MISETNTFPSSVITSHLYITLQSESTMEEDVSIKPDSWLWKSLSESEIFNSMTEVVGDEFRESRDAFIESCISQIIKEHKGESDVVDDMCMAKELLDGRKHCIECRKKTKELKKRSCPDCGGKLVKEMFQ